MGVDEARNKFNQAASELQAYFKKTFGPSHSINIELDMDSFSKLDNMEEALDFFMISEGYYLLQPLRAAMYFITVYEDDEVVDAIAEGLGKITFAHADEKTDVDKKEVEVDKHGNVTFKMVLAGRNWSGFFDQHALQSGLMAGGLKKRGREFKAHLLASAATSYRVRYWGWLHEMKELLNMEGLYYKENEELAKDVQSKSEHGDPVKVFTNLIKINEYKKKQARACAICPKKWYTMQTSGNAVNSKNFKAYNYEDIVCVDVYFTEKHAMVGERKIGMTIWTKEKIEDHSFFGKMKMKLMSGAIKMPIKMPKIPGIPLPSVNLPSISAPSINLPSVSLPSISMPSISLPELPEVDISNPWKRHKAPPPKRYHPATGKNSGVTKEFIWIADGLSTKEGNDLIIEFAYTFYAAYSAQTRRVDYLPFFMEEAKKFDQGTEIDDLREKVTKNK
jgi:hypothetical protein